MSRPPKLSYADFRVIKEIGRRLRELPTQKELAARFNVSVATVGRILHGYDPWKHTVSEFDSARSNGEFCKKTTYNGHAKQL